MPDMPEIEMQFVPVMIEVQLAPLSTDRTMRCVPPNPEASITISFPIVTLYLETKSLIFCGVSGSTIINNLPPLSTKDAKVSSSIGKNCVFGAITATTLALSGIDLLMAMFIVPKTKRFLSERMAI